MQKFRKERVARMLNVMREGLRLDYEGKGLLSFVSNERGSHGGDNVGLTGRSLLTSVKPTRVKPTPGVTVRSDQKPRRPILWIYELGLQGKKEPPLTC